MTLGHAGIMNKYKPKQKQIALQMEQNREKNGNEKE
jgi:hypothetical protein